MQNPITDIKNTLKDIKSWLDEAEDNINDFENKVEINTQFEQQKEKNSEKVCREFKGTFRQHEMEKQPHHRENRWRRK